MERFYLSKKYKDEFRNVGVKDERLWKEKYMFEIMKGKNEKVINNFNHLFFI